jgi:hypothetical protein
LAIGPMVGFTIPWLRVPVAAVTPSVSSTEEVTTA